MAVPPPFIHSRFTATIKPAVMIKAIPIIKRIASTFNLATIPAPQTAPAAAEKSMVIKVTGSTLMTVMNIMAWIRTGNVLATFKVPGSNLSSVCPVNFSKAV